MTETNKLKVINKSAKSSEVPTNQQQQAVENKRCFYKCECKQCERCSKCDYTVNGLRRFYHRDDKLICENCLWDQQKTKQVEKEIITLTGITTSQIRKREKLSDTPAYCFLKAECKNCSQLDYVDLECKKCNADKEDIPVIFRIKENGNWTKPKIPKHSYLKVEGNYSNSDKKRPSFTAYSYQLLTSNLILNQPVQIEYFSHGK